MVCAVVILMFGSDSEAKLSQVAARVDVATVNRPTDTIDESKSGFMSFPPGPQSGAAGLFCRRAIDIVDPGRNRTVRVESRTQCDGRRGQGKKLSHAIERFLVGADRMGPVIG